MFLQIIQRSRYDLESISTYDEHGKKVSNGNADFSIQIPLPFKLDHDKCYDISELLTMRDHYIAFNYFKLPEDLCKSRWVVNKKINKIFNKIYTKTVQGQSPMPTKSNKFIAIFSEKDVKCSVKKCLQLFDGRYVVFVPSLSYHNLEEIHNIDVNIENIKFILLTEYNIDISSYILQSDNSLLELNDLNLYEEPLNNSSRGGKRFIFRSQHLANKLTEIIKTMDKYKENFVTVNEVFRYNKFSPSDKKFTSHYDTAFSNPNKNYQSKYSILIYLTKDLNPTTTLKIFDENNEHNIIVNQEYTCVIFNQKYLHEGIPYLNSDKIFIRSELIYDFSNDAKYYDKYLAQLFNSACYITKQSIETPELGKLIGPLFDKFNKAKNNNKKIEYDHVNDLVTGPLLLKTFKNISYVTNGTEYFFLPSYCLKDIAIIILLDYYSGQFKYYASYKKYIIKTQVLNTNQGLSKSDIETILIEQYFATNFKPLNKTWLNAFDKVKLEQYDDNFCCGFHATGSDYEFNSKNNKTYIEELNVVRNYAYAGNLKLKSYDLIISGELISVNYSNINITDNQILFSNAGFKNSINFASCESWKECGAFKLNICENVGIKLPPIDYIRGSLYCLQIDQFKNGNIYTDKFFGGIVNLPNFKKYRVNIYSTEAYQDFVNTFYENKKEVLVEDNLKKLIIDIDVYDKGEFLKKFEKSHIYNVKLREILQKCVFEPFTSANNVAMRRCIVFMLSLIAYNKYFLPSHMCKNISKNNFIKNLRKEIIEYYGKYEKC
jgi:hypothetical protein